MRVLFRVDRKARNSLAASVAEITTPCGKARIRHLGRLGLERVRTECESVDGGDAGEVVAEAGQTGTDDASAGLNAGPDDDIDGSIAKVDVVIITFSAVAELDGVRKTGNAGDDAENAEAKDEAKGDLLVAVHLNAAEHGEGHAEDDDVEGEVGDRGAEVHGWVVHAHDAGIPVAVKGDCLEEGGEEEGNQPCRNDPDEDALYEEEG